MLMNVHISRTLNDNQCKVFVCGKKRRNFKNETEFNHFTFTPGASRISFLFDLNLIKVMSFVGSRSRKAERAYKSNGNADFQYKNT